MVTGKTGEGLTENQVEGENTNARNCYHEGADFFMLKALSRYHLTWADRLMPRQAIPRPLNQFLLTLEGEEQ